MSTAIASRLEILSKRDWVPEPLAYNLKQANPKTDLGRSIFDLSKWAKLLPADALGELLETLSRSVVLESSLAILVYRYEGNRLLCIEDYGIVGRKQVTDTGVAFLVDAWQNLVELENMKFHGLGIGTTAESPSQPALTTELTTEYTGDIRATGSLTEGATANVFRTVGTNTLDGTPGGALREHAPFSASAAGVMFDRTLFGAINLSSGDALQSTYDLTASSGG